MSSRSARSTDWTPAPAGSRMASAACALRVHCSHYERDDGAAAGERHYTHANRPSRTGYWRLLDIGPGALSSIGAPAHSPSALFTIRTRNHLHRDWQKGATYGAAPVRRDRRRAERGSLSRRDLLAATGGVVLAGSLAGQPPRRSPRVPKPKRGGTFRLGVTGGGAKDIIDGQSITTKPDQARLTSGLGDAARRYDRNYKLGTDGLAEEATQDNAEAVDDPPQGRDRVQQRQDAQRRRRDLLAEADRATRRTGSSAPRASARSTSRASRRWTSSRCACTSRPPDSTIGEQLGQYYNGIVPVGYTSKNKLKWVGTGPFITQELRAGPSERARPQPELLAHAGSRTSTRSGSSTSRTLRAGQRALLGRDRRDDGHPLRADRDGQGPRHQDPRVARRRLAAALHGGRHAAVRRRQRAQGHAADRRPPGHAGAGAARATGASRTTSTRRSTPTTTRRYRSAIRTSTRPSRCSRRPARKPHRRPAHDRRRRAAWSTRPTSSPRRRRPPA